jgi:hypothetical protein
MRLRRDYTIEKRVLSLLKIPSALLFFALSGFRLRTQFNKKSMRISQENV